MHGDLLQIEEIVLIKYAWDCSPLMHTRKNESHYAHGKHDSAN
jgi:hypothetical protein